VKPEGDSGSAAFTFVVERQGDTSQATGVGYFVVGSGEAPADAADFGGGLPSGVVDFGAGETLRLVTIGVAGDLEFEADEEFTVTLFQPAGNARIITPAATGVIQDDDFLRALASLAEAGGQGGGRAESGAEAANAATAAALAAANDVAGSLAKAAAERVAVAAPAESDVSVSSGSGIGAGQESEEEKLRFGEVKLFFRIVGVTGEEGAKEYDIPLPLLEENRLLDLFKKFPNGHYRVYLRQDRTVRKLYDLHVYGNQLVNPEGSGSEWGGQGEACREAGTVDQLARSSPRDWHEQVDEAMESCKAALSKAGRLMRRLRA
jgi:hypothetical protein